jgi:hypothetical protein
LQNNNNIILLCISLKSSRNIFYTCSNIKICKSFRNKQTHGHFYKRKKPAWMEIFGSRRRHAWGKQDVWESYTTTTVAPTPTTNTTTVAAQVDLV